MGIEKSIKFLEGFVKKQSPEDHFNLSLLDELVKNTSFDELNRLHQLSLKPDWFIFIT